MSEVLAECIKTKTLWKQPGGFRVVEILLDKGATGTALDTLLILDRRKSQMAYQHAQNVRNVEHESTRAGAIAADNEMARRQHLIQSYKQQGWSSGQRQIGAPPEYEYETERRMTEVEDAEEEDEEN